MLHVPTPPTGQLVMAAAAGSLLAAVLLLLSSGLQRSAPQPLCPQPCRCPTAALLNCSSSDLSLPPRPIRDSISQLDLSHNLLLGSVALDHPHPNLQVVHLASNNIAHLSLCVEGGGGDAEGRGCESWAPDLRLLSVERNQLHQLPHGESGPCTHALTLRRKHWFNMQRATGHSEFSRGQGV